MKEVDRIWESWYNAVMGKKYTEENCGFMLILKCVDSNLDRINSLLGELNFFYTGMRSLGYRKISKIGGEWKMKIIALILILSQPILSGVKIEKVLETKDVSEYNCWVFKNRTLYPTFRPVLVSAMEECRGTIRKYTIKYYSELGKMLNKEIIEDSLISINIPITYDRILIFRSVTGNENTTVKNEKGEKLFSVPAIVTYVGMNIYIEESGSEASSGSGTKLKVYDKIGKEVGILKGFDGIDLIRLSIPSHERFTIFRAIGGDFPIIIVNAKGKEIWRKKFQGCSDVFLTVNGSNIIISENDKLYVYNLEPISLWKKYEIPQTKILRSFELAENGNWLVVGTDSTVHFYNNLTGKLLWKKGEIFASKSDTIRYVHVMGDGELILSLCKSHNVYVFNQDGVLVKVFNLELGWTTEPKPIRDRNKGMVVGSRYVKSIFSDWKSKVVGNYLIIIKKRYPATSPTNPERIIYRVSLEEKGR